MQTGEHESSLAQIRMKEGGSVLLRRDEGMGVEHKSRCQEKEQT